MLNQAYEERELHRLVYFGGVAPSLRKEVWPFLLGHYQFSMKEKCRQEVWLEAWRFITDTLPAHIFCHFKFVFVCFFQVG